MKFARLLRTTAEDLPELQCLFHIYKHLKKQLKQLPARADGRGAVGDQAAHGGRPGDLPAGGDTAATSVGEEARFTAVLTEHLQRLNDRFLEREETCVIQLERLEAEAAQCSAAAKAAAAEVAAADGSDNPAGAGAVAALNAVAEQRAQLYKRFVNFHGEVLLLVHWSVLAYTATVKILKKHHKRTGLLLRAPQLADLLSQPFCSSELMTGLARKAEACIQRLAEQLAASGTSGGTTATGGTDGAGGAVSGAGGAVAGAAAAGPQDTVDQAAPVRLTAAAAAAADAGAAEAAGVPAGAGGGGADDGSYGAADGSSPSCSQSLRPEHRIEGLQPGGDGAGPSAPPARQRRRMTGTDRGGGSDGGDGGGGTPAGGATFLRNLARLSDNNSAASLSGPFVLEQLVELQQFVDQYDKMDDDDLLDDDDDDDSSAAVGAAVGAAGAAAAPSHGRSHGPSQGLDEGAAAADAGHGTAAAAAEPSGAGGAAAAAPTPGLPSVGGLTPQRQCPEAAAAHAAPALGSGAGDGGAAEAAPAEERVGVATSQPPEGQAGLALTEAVGAAGVPAPASGSGQKSGQGSRREPHRGAGSGLGSGSGSGSGTGSGAAAAAVAAPSAAPQPAGCQLQSSSGSAAAAGGSISGIVSDAFAPRPAAAGNLLRRTQAALTMWEQLRANASTPSTVIDPAVGQLGPGQAHSSGGGGASLSKRRRLAEMTHAAAGSGAAGLRGGVQQESVADDSGSNSD